MPTEPAPFIPDRASACSGQVWDSVAPGLKALPEYMAAHMGISHGAAGDLGLWLLPA